ncbi:MBOAT family O-acyltransferase [Roseicella aquatilis]|uniref:Probable alginate O-acetylase AlgI n=1 Tax=Roseicella aquatilis TaxID=2527868 RepID=A0A4R4D304_9PROT|nr:MBOAT family protein [Roseicella aquatilis]TCZ52267.1 MBOAT family protein [Roseicella aquatilis]
MLFGSLEFVFGFLPAALIAYHLLRLRGWQTAAKLAMVAASLVFYGWWDPRYVLLVLASIAVNYTLGALIHGAAAPGPRKALLLLGLLLNLGLLGYYKYSGFFLQTLGGLFGVEGVAATLIIPLAISFFTFQQIAYLVETWRGQPPASNLLDYLLFVLFFPHLIAGPITHHTEMLPQFHEAGRGRLPAGFIGMGAAIFVLGMAKKVLIADTVAHFADPVFDAAARGTMLSAADAWMGALAYTLQLYFDFSGYSDMAIGIGLLFGIRFPVNFNSPYKARSIVDFWRRWHISLSAFLRTYLYIPLGGSRAGEARRYANLMATMTLGGLWHGAGWTFLFWGFLHGVYLMANHAWSARAGDRLRLPRGLAWLLTMLGVIVAWVFFRAASFGAALGILGAMAGIAGDAGQAGLPDRQLGWLLIAIAGLIAVTQPNVLQVARYPQGLDEAASRVHPGFDLRRLATSPALASVCLGLLAAACIARLPKPGVFLYFTF